LSPLTLHKKMVANARFELVLISLFVPARDYTSLAIIRAVYCHTLGLFA
jgi:hypothetical protein